MHRTSVSRQLSGWRPFQQIELPVDLDFFVRARHSGFRLVFVPRLSVVKFPASWRRNVYKIRGCREQAQWFERIAAEADFEAIELAKMLRIAANQQHRPPLRLWLETTALIGRKARNNLKYQVRRLRFGTKGAKTEAMREFKGLSRRP